MKSVPKGDDRGGGLSFFHFFLLHAGQNTVIMGEVFARSHVLTITE